MSLSVQHFNFVVNLVRQEAAIVLPAGKEYLVESRLTTLVRRTGHPSIAALIGDVERGTHGLSQLVVEALTVNETSWFRDREPFAALTEMALPAVLSASPRRPVRIWSAACSSGQEAYSIAILLDRWLPAGRDFEIVASDISSEMVERARAARFNQLEVNRGLPVGDLVTYFHRVGTDWEVEDRIRRRVSFRQINLARPLPVMAAFDVVFLRNVLIYFAPETKRRVLAQVQRALRPGGWLLLGAAETTVGIDTHYERVPVGRTVIYRSPIDDHQRAKEVTAC